MTPDYLMFVLSSSRAMGIFGEAEKRLKYTPFDDKTFKWKLLYAPTPTFFALRRLLREGGYRFELVTAELEGTKHPVIGDVAILTPWTTVSGPPHILVREQVISREELPLYYESGDWICPQQNFLFDWSPEQAWAFLIDRGITTIEDVCSSKERK